MVENDNLTNNSTTNISSESQTLNQNIKQIVERQAKAWENANSEAIIADFAENSVFIAPGISITGKQNIKKAAEDYFK